MNDPSRLPMALSKANLDLQLGIANLVRNSGEHWLQFARHLVDEGIAEPVGEGIGQLTVSIGVATMQRGESPEGCLDRADTCLYAAKQNGRDRIVADSGESASEEAVEA